MDASRNGTTLYQMVQMHRGKALARRQFDRWAGSYDRSLLNHVLFRPAYLIMLEEIARWRAIHRHAFTVLDIGCGTGSFASLLLETGWPVKVQGVDLSLEMCRTAQTKHLLSVAASRCAFAAADSERLPLASESVDMVTCANSFHHYPHQPMVVHEIRRVLRRNGRAIVVDGFRDNVVGWIAFDVLVSRFEPGVHHASWTEMRSYFEEVGFRNIRQRKSNLVPPILMTVGDVM